jgi:hypothetical protein
MGFVYKKSGRLSLDNRPLYNPKKPNENYL